MKKNKVGIENREWDRGGRVISILDVLVGEGFCDRMLFKFRFVVGGELIMRKLREMF